MSAVITLFIPETSLREAVAEQLAVAGLASHMGDVAQNFTNADLLIIDQAAYDRGFAARWAAEADKPTILLLGEVAEAEGVSESFAKPFRLGHLINRVRYYRDTAPLLRDRTVAFGDFLLEPRQRSLTHPAVSEPLRLTEKETALLMFLADHTEPVARREILASVWGYDERIDTHTLETHLYQLRRKFEAVGVEGIISVNGGYALRREPK